MVLDLQGTENVLEFLLHLEALEDESSITSHVFWYRPEQWVAIAEQRGDGWLLLLLLLFSGRTLCIRKTMAGQERTKPKSLTIL